MVLLMELWTYRKHISDDMVTTGCQAVRVGQWGSGRRTPLITFPNQTLVFGYFHFFFFSEGLAQLQDELLLCLKNPILKDSNTSPENHYWI